MLNGLTSLNIELTSRCNKDCWMCGRRVMERKHPNLCDWGDIDFDLLESIAKQLPPNIVVQLHNNGEPTLYPRLGEAIGLFKNQITQFDTNGKLMVEKAKEIIGNLDIMTVSVIQGDLETDQQYENIEKFLYEKENKKPLVVLRLLGDVNRARYERFGCIIATRVLHNPMGSFDYMKKPIIPEIGVCQDLLHRMAIDRFGRVSLCVRFDPDKLGFLGYANQYPLDILWDLSRRINVIKLHLQGRRSEVPMCARCDYWGYPAG